ncbi:hypothetical protein CW304_19125 [Bacillus sp. UFRGS-B20]|nr:hypothetical protein CW304_19125 [Bacillus sp. UFRGS-B20]
MFLIFPSMISSLLRFRLIMNIMFNMFLLLLKHYRISQVLSTSALFFSPRRSPVKLCILSRFQNTLMIRNFSRIFWSSASHFVATQMCCASILLPFF